MSAPRLFCSLLAAAALVAGGCAAPGAQRLQGPPEGMPPVLQHVTADVLGFALYATDRDEWPGVTGVAAGPVLEQLHGSIGMTPDEVEPWIGDHAGIVLRQLDVPGTKDDTTAYVADVRDRAELGEALDASGWDQAPDDDLPQVNGADPSLATRDDGEFRAAALFDDGVVVARSEEGLREFLEAADEYAVPERRAMSQYAADVAQTGPAGAVFRFDIVRTQLRRPFQEDPAMLELARWATDSDVLHATRDGWIGLAPGGDDDDARLIGAVEWVPDLAPEIDWGEADRAMLDETADVSIAFDDAGQHLTELVRAITSNKSQFATEQDVPEGEERIELEELFDELDGAAAMHVRDGRPILEVDGADDVAEEVDDLMCNVGIPGDVASHGGDLHVGFGGAAACRPARPPVPSVGAPTAERPAIPAPPSPPIIRVWARSIAGCTGPAAGWVTFDGEGEMTFAIGVDRGGISYRPATATGSDGAAAGGIAPRFCDLRALVPFT